MVGEMARMTSRSSESSAEARATSESMCKSDGPTPSMGEITPPSTWYTPLYWPVFSMAMTSRTSDTTHTRLWSRSLLAQMPHSSASEMLWQVVQYVISKRILASASASEAVVSISALSRCRARRNAVLRPMPGRRASSPTAFSISFEGNSIQKM